MSMYHHYVIGSTSIMYVLLFFYAETLIGGNVGCVECRNLWVWLVGLISGALKFSGGARPTGTNLVTGLRKWEVDYKSSKLLLQFINYSRPLWSVPMSTVPAYQLLEPSLRPLTASLRTILRCGLVPVENRQQESMWILHTYDTGHCDCVGEHWSSHRGSQQPPVVSVSGP